MKNFYLFGLLILTLVSNVISNDPIQKVPGYTKDSIKVYQGFLQTSMGRLHYILIQGDEPALTLWMGDGPGCSSKIAFLSQIAPFYLPAGQDYTDKDQNLAQNQNSWHQKSSLLFIDSPAGVGYSIAGNSQLFNDQNTAQQNLQALVNFYSQFPKYNENTSFYLAGQSYAGKFIPDLALRIVANNAYSNIKINLKGILVGNGIMDLSNQELKRSQVNYMFSHNFIDPTLDKYWEQSCETDPTSAGCQFFLRRYDQILDRVNYQRIYGTCYQEKSPTITRINTLNTFQNKKIQFYNTFKKCQKYGGIQSYFVKNNNTFRVKPNFVACNQTIYQIYSPNQSGSMNQYARLINQTNIKIFLYAGDWDDIVPYTNTIRNIEKLGLRQSGQINYWYDNNQHAGFIRTYMLGNNKQILKFWIIKGAGHQVSRHRSDLLYQIFKSMVA